MADMERPVDSLTRGPRHHLSDYYDECPWDSTGPYVLGLETGFVGRAPDTEDRAVVGMVDLVSERRRVRCDLHPCWTATARQSASTPPMRENDRCTWSMCET